MFDKISNQGQTTTNQAQASQQNAGQQPSQQTQRPAAQVQMQKNMPSTNSHGKPNKLVIVLLVIFLLLIGGGALAYYQEWYKVLPFFQEKEQEIKGNLTNMMYERLAQLDGADFELTYSMNVGARDADAEVPEFSKNAKFTSREETSIKESLESLAESADFYYEDNNSSYEDFCDNYSTNRVDTFKCIDDVNNWAASVNLSDGFWCVDNTSLELKPTTEEIKSYNCTGLRELESSPVSKSNELNFLTGEYLENSWMYIENTIPEDLRVEVKFTGSGFSLAGREEGKQDLPDVKVGLFGSAKLNSATFDLGIEAMAVKDSFYYMVSDFPMIDITKGHPDEWIKVSPESSWMSEIIPEYDDEQKQAVERFRNFIADTQKYDILSFSQTDKILNIGGKQVNLFDVSINAENIPAWLEEARKIALESAKEEDLEELSFMGLDKDEMTEEEKTKLIEDVNKAMKNIKISVGIDMEEGDLMMIDMTARFIPPASSEKFKDKQFNFVANLKLTNHNNPPAIVAPEVYVDQEEIEQEELGMTDEQYQDYKQAQRVVKVREELLKYYKENREFPSDLSMVTRLTEDRNTGQEFKYTARQGNFELVYSMNTDIAEPEEEQEESSDFNTWGMRTYDNPKYILKNAMGSDYVTHTNNIWHKGDNVADRYSLIADQTKDSKNLLVEAAKNNNYSDKDVYQALHQARIVKQTKDLLKNYYRENKKYPDSILDLKERYSYFSLYNFSGFICEDLNTGKYCDYSATQDGSDYEIKISFPLNFNVINKNKAFHEYDYEQNFVEGENIFTSQIVVDSDRDGLNDRDEEKYGTDKYNYDTDGDGYSDGEEVANGYNPLENANTNTNSDENDLFMLEGASYWVRGDVDAPITIMVYSDYDCPFCQRHHANMKLLMEEYDGDIKWIHRHFPLEALHPDAEDKAMAAECIGELGGNDAFWQFTDYLYDEKPALSDLADKVEELGYAKDSWQTCVDENRYKSIISSQIKEAIEAGARGTPYSLIIHKGTSIPLNGALPYESIKNQIDNLL